MPANGLHNRILWIILLIGLLLRLAFALAQPTYARFDHARGGDTGWYLVNGYGFFSGERHGWVENLPFYVDRIPTPPLYILFAGFVQQFMGRHETVVVMRLLQCLASIATVYLASRLSLLITGDSRAAATVALLVAFHPAFVTEPARIATETLYIFFLAAGFWIYTEYGVLAFPRQHSGKVSPSRAMLLTAAAFALATLTRAVAMLFPAVLVLHLLLLGRRRQLTVWRRLALLLVMVYAATVATWTIYNFVLWDRLVIVSDQLLPALWRGAETQDGSPAQNDALLLEGIEVTVDDDCEVDCKYQHPPELYVGRIAAILDADIAGFFLRRLNELTYSLVQPHGAASFGQASIREAAADMLSHEVSVERLLALARRDGFALKAATWAFHLGAMLAGIAGMWLARERLALTFPLIGFILYTIVAHLFLLALPRYMFPLDLIWLIFAGICLVSLYDRLRRRAAV